MANKKKTTKTSTSARKQSIPIWVWGIAGVALVALIVAVALLSNPAAGTETQSGNGSPAQGVAGESMPLEVSVVDAASRRIEGAFMLDVRESEEWEAGHIPDATLIPLGELQGRLSEIPKDQEVVVVCRSGNRSAQGRDILLQAGYTNVTSMAGGMNDWTAQGLPVETGP